MSEWMVSADAQHCVIIEAPSRAVVAQYHPETDTVTFDWPRIEQEAVNKAGWFHGIAKILLAAREVGIVSAKEAGDGG